MKEDLTDSTATVITAERLARLPLLGRDMEELALLEPTVTPDYASGTVAFRGEPLSYNVIVDGMNVGGRYRWVQKDAGSRFAPGSIDEAQILSDYMPGPFTMAMGGFVNMVTRTAGEDLHGEAYGTAYNPSLSSVGRFADGYKLTQSDRVGGASAGRAIVRKHVFLFTNYEAHDGRSDDLNRILNPLITDSNGNVNPVNCKAAATLCTSAIKFIQQQLNVLVPANWHESTALAKLDVRLGKSNALHFEANGMDGRVPNGFQTGSVITNGGILGNTDSKHQTRFGKFGWTSLPVGTTTNEMRFGLYQDYVAQTVNHAGLSTGELGIQIAGSQVGATNTFVYAYRERRVEFADTVDVTTGSHVVKATVDIVSDVDRLDSLENYAGSYLYSSLTAFAQDFSGSGQKNYYAYTQKFGTTFRSEQTRETMVSAEDTWRALPRLTIDVSLRWEKPYPPKPHVAAGFYFETGSVNSTNINVEPRVAVALQANSKTVIRSAFGMYNDPHPGEMLDALFLGNGIYQTNMWATPTLSGVPAFPNNITLYSSIPTGTTEIFETKDKLRNPYVQQNIFVVERKYSDNTTWSITALHNRTIKLWLTKDINLQVPVSAGSYTIYNSANQPTKYPLQIYTLKDDASRSRVYEIANGGSAWYNALQFQIRKRMVHGLTWQGTYVWSHSLDTVGGAPSTGGLPMNVFPGQFGLDKGNSSSDQRHRGTIEWTWQPKLIANDSWAAKYLANGWQLSGMGIVASPEGTTPLIIMGGQQIASLTMVYTNTLNGSGGWARAPFEQINSLKGQYQTQVNARLSKSVPINEKIKGSLIFEGFNVLNRQYTTSVSPVAYSVTSGAIRGVTGAGEPIASQGYPGQLTARTMRLAFQLVF